MLENIIALIGAISPIALAIITLWRYFVRKDMKIRTQENALAIAEQQATRESQQEQNKLFQKIMENSEKNMETLVGVIATFTQAQVRADELHDKENVRHVDLMTLLNTTLDTGLKNNAVQVQVLGNVVKAFAVKAEAQANIMASIFKSTQATFTTVSEMNATIGAVKKNLDDVQSSMVELVRSNGNLVEREQIIKLSQLLDKKTTDIMKLLKEVQPAQIVKEIDDVQSKISSDD